MIDRLRFALEVLLRGAPLPRADLKIGKPDDTFADPEREQTRREGAMSLMDDTVRAFVLLRIVEGPETADTLLTAVIPSELKDVMKLAVSRLMVGLVDD